VEGASEAVDVILQLMRDVRPSPLMTLMVAFPRSLDPIPWDGAVVTNSPVLQWVSRDSSKPGEYPPACS
jgi:predicted NAD/FAD-dependent oxidoreductase